MKRIVGILVILLLFSAAALAQKGGGEHGGNPGGGHGVGGGTFPNTDLLLPGRCSFSRGSSPGTRRPGESQLCRQERAPERSSRSFQRQMDWA